LQKGQVILRGVDSKGELSDLLKKQADGVMSFDITSGTVECNKNKVVILAD
jgi:hypothetical protein